jgi:hypothetical protein
MAREKKAPSEHTDLLGQKIVLGSLVAAARQNQLKICNVTKLNPKMIRLVPVNGGHPSAGFQVFGHQAVVVEGEDVLSFILKGNKG